MSIANQSKNLFIVLKNVITTNIKQNNDFI